jgi:DNA-binding PadR family transcriptional regulator
MLTPTQYDILQKLARGCYIAHNYSGNSPIYEGEGDDRKTVGEVKQTTLDALTKRGWVGRGGSPNDRRIVITEAGRMVMQSGPKTPPGEMSEDAKHILAHLLAGWRLHKSRGMSTEISLSPPPDEKGRETGRGDSFSSLRQRGWVETIPAGRYTHETDYRISEKGREAARELGIEPVGGVALTAEQQEAIEALKQKFDQTRYARQALQRAKNQVSEAARLMEEAMTRMSTLGLEERASVALAAAEARWDEEDRRFSS